MMKIIALSLVGVAIVVAIILVRGGVVPMSAPSVDTPKPAVPTATPVVTTVTITGTYVCLPPKPGVTTADCAFGIKTDAGEYYAVNFGASAGSMADFQNGATITATGTLIPRAELTPDSWTSFEMSGLFTILKK